MKFGKAIQNQQVTEWGNHYANYKGLKKQIKTSLACVNEKAFPTSVTIAAQHPPVLAEDATTGTWQNANKKTAFFFKLERELEKVNSFYLHKESELKVRLRTLLDKKKILQARKLKTSRVSLKEAFSQFQQDLNKLQKFVEINGTAFQKILKKWDKRSKSTTKELYLSRQVEVQPCFNKDILAELSDTAAAHLSELDNPNAVSGEKSMPSSPQSSGFLFDSSNVGQATLSNCQSLAHIDDQENDLFRVIHFGDSSRIRQLLRKRTASATQEDKEVVSRVFWRACSEKFSELVRELIDTGLVDFNHVDDISNRTCLHEASIAGHLSLMEVIVHQGGNLESVDFYGRRPLHYVSMHGHSNCATFLLSRGAHVSPLDHDGFSPLIYSVIGGHTKCVEIFLDNGASIDAHVSEDGGQGPLPLALACQYGHTDVSTLLLKRGAQISPNADGLGPLHFAARAGHADLTRLLTAHGAPLDAPDKYQGWTPIFYGVSEGHLECARILIQAGASVAITDESGATPMYYAASEGHMECVQMLVQARNLSITAPVDGENIKPRCTLAYMDGEPESGIIGPMSTLAASDHAIKIDDGQNLDLDLDSIPSLSLPPPILPFRIYGHNYLDKKSQVQLTMGHMHSRNSIIPPVLLYGARQISSLKLVMTPRPDKGMIPHTVMLPLSDELETFSFLVDDLDDFALEFDIYPSFGSRLMGRAIALPSMFNFQGTTTGRSSGKSVCPLLDSHLKVIGELAFEFAIVKPFRGAELEIGGHVETYWKATTHAGKAATATTAVSMSPALPNGDTVATPSMPALDHPAPLLLTGFAGSVMPSFITASSLSSEYMQLVVQLTRDGIPVVHAGWKLPITQFDLSVGDATFSQFKSLNNMMVINQDTKKVDSNDPTAILRRTVYDNFMSLEEALQILPPALGANIEIRYPTKSEMKAYRLSNTPDINLYVDIVLQAVYDHVHMCAARRKNGLTNAETRNGGANSDGLNLTECASEPQRSFIFSSFNPAVCTAVNWKQPNYAVFFNTYAGVNTRSSRGQKRKKHPTLDAEIVNGYANGTSKKPSTTTTKTAPWSTSLTRSLPLQRSYKRLEDDEIEDDRRCTSIKEAVRFAKTNNLLGVVCEATPLIQVPELITTVKESGLILATFGPANNDSKNVRLQEFCGVDAMVIKGMLKYSGGQVKCNLS